MLSLGSGMPCAPLSRVGNSSRLPTHIPSSKTRSRCNDPSLTEREAPREPTDTSTDAATGVARYGSFVGEGFGLLVASYG
jgi:hypothetical protein